MASKKAPSNYFSWFLFNNKNQELTDMIRKTMDPVKEVTEITGIVKAVLNNHELFNVQRSDRDTVCYVWGDGFYPFAGALLSQLTAWQIVSIDPRMKKATTGRVTSFKGLSNEFAYQPTKNAVVLGMHSHAPLSDLSLIKSDNIRVCWCPCCFPVTDITVLSRYRDPCILSEKNEIVLGSFSGSSSALPSRSSGSL